MNEWEKTNKMLAGENQEMGEMGENGRKPTK